MKEVQKLDKIYLDEISRLLSDPRSIARINDYDDGTRDYWIDGGYDSSPFRIDYDKDAKEYTLKLRTKEGYISYKEGRNVVDSDQNSVIAGLTEKFIKKYNNEQHKKVESTRAEKVAAAKDAPKKEGKNSVEAPKLNKFHLATIDLIFKDPSYSAAINDYNDGTRGYFMHDTAYVGKYGDYPLRIDLDGNDYVLTLKTNEGKFSYREPKGSVDKNPNSVMAKIVEKFIKKYNANQHARAQKQQMAKLATERHA